MQVTVNVPDQIAAEAAARGVSVDAYIEEVLAKQARQEVHTLCPASAAEAVDRIRSLRQGVTLGGLAIKDMIHEGHRY